MMSFECRLKWPGRIGDTAKNELPRLLKFLAQVFNLAFEFLPVVQMDNVHWS